MAGERPRRDKKNLEGLLKFCVESTSAEDPTARSSFEEMDPERRKFLEEAIAEYTANDEVTLIKKCLEILAQPTGALSKDEEEDVMTRENAMEQLEGVVDIIDNAKDLYKLNGFQVLMNYLDSPHTTLQWRAASVLGLCLQNNTYCQNQALKLNLLPKLLKLLDSETSDDQIKIKSLYAVACFIRGHPEAEETFVRKNGFSYLLRALHRNIPKLNVKSIFLLSNLIDEKKEYLEILYDMGMVDQLISIIQHPHDPYHEHAFNILVKFVTHYPPALKDCGQEKYNLRETLENRRKFLTDKDPDAFQEELDLCNQLTALCFGETQSDNQENTER